MYPNNRKCKRIHLKFNCKKSHLRSQKERIKNILANLQLISVKLTKVQMKYALRFLLKTLTVIRTNKCILN